MENDTLSNGERDTLSNGERDNLANRKRDTISENYPRRLRVRGEFSMRPSR